MEDKHTTIRSEEKKIQLLRGVVVSDAMDKTRVVLVTRYIAHPKYKKYIKSNKRYKVHDPENAYHVGDRVIIRASSPISRHKAFVIAEKIGTADVSQYLKVHSRET